MPVWFFSPFFNIPGLVNKHRHTAKRLYTTWNCAFVQYNSMQFCINARHHIETKRKTLQKCKFSLHLITFHTIKKYICIQKIMRCCWLESKEGSYICRKKIHTIRNYPVSHFLMPMRQAVCFFSSSVCCAKRKHSTIFHPCVHAWPLLLL